MTTGQKVFIKDDEDNIIEGVFLYKMDGIAHVRVDGVETEFDRNLVSGEDPNKPIIDKELQTCQSGNDGECYHELCLQNRDGEPEKTGRSCPLYDWNDTRE